MFKTYPSNIPSGTSHNWILCYHTPRHITARGYFRVLSHKPDVWRFWFSNAVDSTFSDGAVAYPDRPGGNWKILSARVGDGGAYVCAPMDTPNPVTNWTNVTFDDGKTDRDVVSGERFWSDEVSFSLPAGHMLVWEWEIYGNEIPCTPDSQAATFTAFDDEPLTAHAECPLPDLFGAKRDAAVGDKRNAAGRVVFLGDSITEGCGTRNNHYENWAARIALALGETYSFWNIGLGWARGSDAAEHEYWKYKAAQGDTVCLVTGVNDILHGKYQGTHFAHADEIVTTVEKLVRYLKNAGCRVILFTIPPFDFNAEQYMVWKTLRYAYPALAAELGVELYDFSASLDGRPPYGNRFIHGPHPDGSGGSAAADAFLAAGIL